MCFSVDCVWSLWSHCNVSCGSGVQSRHIQISNQDGGEKCLGDSTRPCTNTSSCPLGRGQLILKGLFGFFNSPKKRTKNFCPGRLGQKLTFSSSVC